MTIGDVVIAVPAIQKLILQDLPLPIAWRLSKLVGIINPVLDFYNTRREQCADEQAALELLAFDISDQFAGYTPAAIPITDDLSLSAADVAAVDPFVVFEEVT